MVAVSGYFKQNIYNERNFVDKNIKYWPRPIVIYIGFSSVPSNIILNGYMWRI